MTYPDTAPETKLATLVEVGVDEHVFRVGSEVEIDVGLTVAELFDEGSGHVLVHHCRQIAVTVSYVGNEQSFEVHPSAHVKAVLKRAIKAFDIDPTAAADLVLRSSGSSDDLPPNSPIGAFVARGTCAVHLDLVHLVRPQG
ncbi:hypothetical protein [Amycolatopsis sp. CA-128772]|uniref:hypothetical protein n=1 Tax=Amycolatopsis sp. CA-128772 TaxID=2073159 RepID=UPI000CD28286|nr:hypothetical protein [Amycolatopsis sp. CA-128772]